MTSVTLWMHEGRCQGAQPPGAAGAATVDDAPADVSHDGSVDQAAEGTATSSEPAAATEPAAAADLAAATTDPTAAGKPAAAQPLPELPVPGALEGIKSRKRPVLTMGLRRPNPGTGDAQVGTFTLQLCMASRVTLGHLARDEACELLAALAPADGECSKRWEVSRHAGLKVVAMSVEAPLEEELRRAVAAGPHLLCVPMEMIRSQLNLCAILRKFKGAIVVVEDESASIDDPSIIGPLVLAGITERWCALDGGEVWQQAAAPAVPATEIIGDITSRDVETKESIALLVEQVQPLYDEHFHADLREELSSWEGARLAFLVRARPKAADGEPQQEALGVIVYKFWEPPLRAMSIPRLVVLKKWRMLGCGRLLMRWAMDKAQQKPPRECTKVTLCAMPEAIPFYERLKFAPRKMEEEEASAEAEGSTLMPGAVWMEYRCGKPFKPPARKR